MGALGLGHDDPARLQGRQADGIEANRLVEEDVTFRLPVELRRELELAAQS